MPAWKIIAFVTGLYLLSSALLTAIEPPTPETSSPTESTEPVGSVKGAADFCNDLTDDLAIENPLYAEDFRQGCFERTVD